jgi:vitamin K-dependent gamma-carboxylase-like protein
VEQSLPRQLKVRTSCQVSPLGLAVFRIVYGLVLWAEVAQLVVFRRLIFDEVPYLSPPALGVGFCLALWLIAVSAIIVGSFARLACVLNYALSVLFFGSLTTFEYHADHIYTTVNFLLIFTPIAERLSFDRWLAARQGSPLSVRATVSIWHYHTLLLAGVGLVYFDSFFWKICDPMWTEGLGVWLPMSLPHDTWLPATWLTRLLNRHWLMLAASYTTLALEFAFIFLMWFRAPRVVLLAIGLTFHFGILIAFPIPLFALVMISLYALLVPQDWWDQAAEYISSRVIAKRLRAAHSESPPVVPRRRAQEAAHFRVDFANPEPATSATHKRRAGIPVVVSATIPRETIATASNSRLVGDISSEEQESTPSDVAPPVAIRPINPIRPLVGNNGLRAGSESCCDLPLRAKIAFVSIAVVWQLILIFQTPVFQGKDHVPSSGTSFAVARDFVYRYFGVCSHAVFLDYMHRSYDRELALVQVLPQGGLRWLHLVSETGQARRHNSGRVWCAWTHRIAAKNVDANSFGTGVRNYTAFWAKRRGIDLADARFLVFSRQCEPVQGWERNYLLRQTQQPWTPIFEARWKDRQFSIVSWETPVEIAQR